MSLTINAAQLSTPKTTGLSALNSAKQDKGSDNELRQSFDSFVGETFYSQMIKSMHKLHGKPAYFYGGHAEEAFQQQLDQTWAQQMTKATAHSFTGPMFEHFMMNRQ
jgi:Rod binding domain-containing protein